MILKKKLKTYFNIPGDLFETFSEKWGQDETFETKLTIPGRSGQYTVRPLKTKNASAVLFDAIGISVDESNKISQFAYWSFSSAPKVGEEISYAQPDLYVRAEPQALQELEVAKGIALHFKLSAIIAKIEDASSFRHLTRLIEIQKEIADISRINKHLRVVYKSKLSQI